MSLTWTTCTLTKFPLDPELLPLPGVGAWPNAPATRSKLLAMIVVEYMMSDVPIEPKKEWMEGRVKTQAKESNGVRR